MVNITINIDGDYEEDYIDRAMTVLGELIINKVKENIKDMGLVDSGAFLQGWISKWNGIELYVENIHEYSLYLEYGTYGYWQKNGLKNYTEPPDPKKKDLSLSQRKQYPKGMQSFAPLRKVLYNEQIFSKLLKQAFESQL